ncbi:beta-galactosidase [Cellulomonas rhizosphaerae]|uniref:Beta-galactosidase n=1 Tax=Cellulomonas rhizosphaerae TaxID=2293719 RepID=A0A413RIL8_9CELL|nr:beta-galactosidase [Cellulomonas rhizosphaerae]RHA38153.1 beta-galactosidase [Cellulomonas rhizosphaerae]
MESRAQRHPAAPHDGFAHEGIAFGCDYNPEQWDESVWAEDVALMQAAHIDLVAINIFGWSHLQGPDGIVDFTGLDTVVGLLHDAGIRINLGTGTASPPPWLTTRHPEILPMAQDGTTRFPGGRQAWCPSSPVFRRYALELVEQVAARYGDHPGVAVWHVSNELGCHNALCYCDESAAAFRRWLEARYGTIERLNAAWGTTFWSQRYYGWDEIGTPRLTLSTRNPGQVLDFQRFSSDEVLGYYLAEAETIRRHSRVAVTTNFMVTAHIRNLDYWDWAGHVDVVANDHYLDHRLEDPTAELAFAADATRGLAQGAPWLLMEHSTGAVNWQPLNLTKGPGEMVRNSLTHVARGADGVCFFQWRASQQGSEKFHSALVPHAGTDSASWREVVELGDLVDRLGEVAGTRVEADVALVFSWENWWAAEAEMRPSHDVAYLDQVHALYGALHAAGVTVDVVRPGADLSGYRVVVVPGLYLVSDAAATELDDYVQAGGTAVVTFFSGIVDEDDRVRLGGYPGAFRDLLGVRVEEFAPLRADESVALSSGATARLWTERLTTTTATAVDSFVDGPASGVPAVTRNARGTGTAWYVATTLDSKSLGGLVERVLAEAGVDRHPAAGNGLDVVRRSAADRSYLFLINHRTDDVDVDVVGHELVTGTWADASVTVPAGAVRIIRERSAA